MGDDKQQDSTDEVADQKTKEAEDGEKKKQGSTDTAAPADDDIIIK